MAELSIAYELIGPDGTRAVVGNSDAARADPDYVGSLDPENGITGLLDAPATRLQTTDLVEADGSTAGPGFATGRPGTMQGLLRPDAPELAEAALSKLKRATRALRSDGILRWTPSASSSPRMLRFRRQAGPTPSGRRPKAYQVSLWSGDPYALAASETSALLTPGAGAGELGIADPITDPLTSILNPAGSALVVNLGDAPTWPRFRVYGPITNPELVNYTAGGARIPLLIDVGPLEFIDVYPRLAVVLLGNRLLGSTVVNELTNPSFELSTAGWQNGGFGTTFARQNGWAAAGAGLWALRLTGTINTNNMTVNSPAFAAAAGEVIGARARLNILTAATGTGPRLNVQFDDGSNTWALPQFVGPASAWALGELDVATLTTPAPAGTVQARIRPSVATNGNETVDMYLDAVLAARRVTAVPSYADGDMADYEWTGAPHASSTVPLIDDDEGMADRYGNVDHARAEWWRLEPGANDVRLEAAAGSGQTIVYLRHAWE